MNNQLLPQSRLQQLEDRFIQDPLSLSQEERLEFLRLIQEDRVRQRKSRGEKVGNTGSKKVSKKIDVADFLKRLAASKEQE